MRRRIRTRMLIAAGKLQAMERAVEGHRTEATAAHARAMDMAYQTGKTVVPVDATRQPTPA